MKRRLRGLALVLTLVCVVPAMLFATGAQETASGTTKVSSLPRSETLYFNGLQWGTAASHNPIGASGVDAFITNNNAIPRLVIYETLFAYNQMDGKLYGLLGKDYTWKDDGKVLSVTLKPAAHWNDGVALTADDVVYTYKLGQKYMLNISSVWSYLDDVRKVDDYTVEFVGSSKNYNRLMMEYAISAIYIMPKHIWEKREAEAGNDGAKLMQIVNEDTVASGPYKLYSSDDTKIVLVRDDNYWGKDPSMFGKLPKPKYLAHNIFKDNASGDAALRANQVDISQQFISQVWKMWEGGAPVKTYLSELPYYVPGTIPWLIINVHKSGLDDPVVRRAIAMSIDYSLIAKNAMSGYTAKMVPSLLLPTDVEQSLVDTNALKPYQWGATVDVAGANKLLDDAGWKKGSDGIREKNGVKLSFKVECPSGWSDWQASLEVVSQSTKAIGMDIHTYYPEAGVMINDMQTGNFDLCMYSYSGIGISSPWDRARTAMSSVDLPAIGQTAYHNYGRYSNPEADKLIQQIANETDSATLKKLWTDLNLIYLKDIPCIGLMYRPNVFYTVNTSVWDGFPMNGDGTNVPPALCTDGYGIWGLYNLHAKK
jgi:peptide/nickel transport system substrate-binding protein